jgi:hypothetical protein
LAQFLIDFHRCLFGTDLRGKLSHPRPLRQGFDLGFAVIDPTIEIRLFDKIHRDEMINGILFYGLVAISKTDIANRGHRNHGQ